MKRFAHAWMLLSAMLMLTACPQPEPEPVPDPDVNVSLGKTDAITPSVLVGDDLQITSASDGSALIRYADQPVDMSFALFGDYDAAKPFRRYVNYPISYDFQLGKKPTVSGYSQEIDLMTVMPSTIDLGNRSKGMTIAFNNLPTELLALDAIELTPESRFELSLSFPDAFFTEGTITPSFSVDMSHFFKTPETENDILQFDVPLTAENGYSATKSFRISSVALDPNNFDAKDHKLFMDARIGLSGTVAFDGLKTTRSKLSAAPSDMKLHVTVILYDLAVKSVTGRFEYTVKPVTHTFKLSDALSATGVNLSSSSLGFDVETDLNYPFSGKTDVTARKSRKAYAEVKGVLFDFPVAEEGKTASKTSRPDGSVDLSPLFAQTPDELVMQLGAVSHTDATGTIELGKETHTSVRPVLESQVSLDDKFETVIKRTLPVQSSVGVALKEKKKVSLTGTLENSLPLDGEMSVVLVDGNGRALVREVKQAITADSKANVSQALSAVTTATEGVTSAEVTFTLRGKSSARVLKSSDQLQAALNILIQNE